MFRTHSGCETLISPLAEEKYLNTTKAVRNKKFSTLLLVGIYLLSDNVRTFISEPDYLRIMFYLFIPLYCVHFFRHFNVKRTGHISEDRNRQ